MFKVKKLSCGYNGKDVIKDVSFSMEKGERLTIIGPNGCGKTTILKALARLFPYRGDVSFDSRDLVNMDRKSIAKLIALMSQKMNVYFPYTVFDVVSFGRYASIEDSLGRLGKEDKELVINIIEEVGLIEERNKLITELSGGQFQRVFLARAFAQDPEILLLDEPTNHLDMKSQYDFLDQVNRWAENREKIIISVIHDLNLATAFSNRGILIDKGKVVLDSSVENIMRSGELQNVYKIDVREKMIDSLRRWE